jgi:chromosome segregation ATPase
MSKDNSLKRAVTNLTDLLVSAEEEVKELNQKIANYNIAKLAWENDIVRLRDQLDRMIIVKNNCEKKIEELEKKNKELDDLSTILSRQSNTQTAKNTELIGQIHELEQSCLKYIDEIGDHKESEMQLTEEIAKLKKELESYKVNCFPIIIPSKEG